MNEIAPPADPQARVWFPPSGEWNEDDFDVLAGGAVGGHIFKANATPVGDVVDVDAGLRASGGSNADAWLGRDAVMLH